METLQKTLGAVQEKVRELAVYCSFSMHSCSSAVTEPYALLQCVRYAVPYTGTQYVPYRTRERSLPPLRVMFSYTGVAWAKSWTHMFSYSFGQEIMR